MTKITLRPIGGALETLLAPAAANAAAVSANYDGSCGEKVVIESRAI